MPETTVKKRAQKAKREGKAPTTQAGEFVREEMEHIGEGERAPKNQKQAIAIGLSKARRAGVKLPPRPARTTKKAGAAKRTRKASAKPSKPKATSSTRRTSSKATGASKTPRPKARGTRSTRATASPRATARRTRQSPPRRKRTSTPRSRTKQASAAAS